MKNFISKLNDRNLQRKRESGVTTYVLLSALALIIYQIANLYKNQTFKNNSYYDIVYIVTYITNTFMAILFIVLPIFSSDPLNRSIRIVYKKNSISMNSCLIFSAIFLFSIIPTSLLLIRTFSNNLFFFDAFVFIVILNCFLILLILLFVFGFLIEKDKLSIMNSPNNNLTKFFIVSISTCVIIIGIYRIKMSNYIGSKTDLMIFLGLIFLVLIISSLIIDLNETDEYTRDLEDLEYEIHIKDLSDDQIKKKLQDKYLGYFIENWVEHQYIVLDHELLLFQSHLNTLVNTRNEIDTVDKIKYPIEYSGRMTDYELNKVNHNHKINKFVSVKTEEINIIMEKQKKLNTSEIDLLNNLKNKIETDFKSAIIN